MYLFIYLHLSRENTNTNIKLGHVTTPKSILYCIQLSLFLAPCGFFIALCHYFLNSLACFSQITLILVKNHCITVFFMLQ